MFNWVLHCVCRDGSQKPVRRVESLATGNSSNSDDRNPWERFSRPVIAAETAGGMGVHEEEGNLTLWIDQEYPLHIS